MDTTDKALEHDTQQEIVLDMIRPSDRIWAVLIRHLNTIPNRK